MKEVSTMRFLISSYELVFAKCIEYTSGFLLVPIALKLFSTAIDQFVSVLLDHINEHQNFSIQMKGGQ